MGRRMRKTLQRWLLPIQHRLLAKVHDLSYLFVEVTQRCNLRCVHCGTDCKQDSRIPDLALNKILPVLDRIRAAGDPGRVHVVLTGGEPLCYPDLFRLGRGIGERGFSWGMVTNGFALDENRLLEAKKASMSSVTVSLDGLEEDHDWFRGRKGAFERACKAIELLVGDPFWRKMDVITCVHKRNLASIEKIHELLVKNAVPGWRIFTVEPIGRAPGNPELFLSPGEFRMLLERIHDFRSQQRLQVSFSDSGYLGPCHEEKVRDYRYFCRAGINVAGIMVNGDILACPNIDRRFAQGNIFRDDFLTVWQERYQDFRNRLWMKQGECQRCGQWRHCKGNSFHLRDFQTRASRLCHCKEYQLLPSSESGRAP